jgi:ADP-dependent NAD(P)H-hydrate dehydratase / NAD(P)H-hydrate epimerase
VNIYSTAQIKEWDAYTIQHEPIASIDLMERAAQKCVEWILANKNSQTLFRIFCGKGNNGGDGLAIARFLFEKNFRCEVYVLEFGKPGSDDFQANLQRLHEFPVTINFIQSANHFPEIFPGDIIIDALFGSGLNKPLEGFSQELVNHLNSSPNEIISIDLPSGLFADQSSKGNTVIKANHTLSFQTYKKAFLVAENEAFIGDVHFLDIGLHPDFLKMNKADQQLVDEKLIKQIFQPRRNFAHKGSYGHALLIGGSYGKIGALVLAGSAALRGGAGLVTTYLPACGYSIIQSSIPEAMAITDPDESMITKLPEDLEKYSAIGVGPGIGTNRQTRETVFELLKAFKKPIVIDADALNALAIEPAYLNTLTTGSILTPHPKEFDRLFGTSENEFERIYKAIDKAKELNITIVLKGHHTLVAMPNGISFFNNTGNAGMAKGGTGDVLTGIIAALCAQHYNPGDAALLGVYLHGFAGDLAAAALSKEAMTAGDLVRFLSPAFLKTNS